jgi:5-formyltetrahydrofolate cyclo-ligase
MLPPDAHIIQAVKAALRKRMRGVRGATPRESCQKRSAKIVASLLLLPELVRAQEVALFWPIEARHEVDLRTLDDALQRRGARVYYPSIDTDTREMTFRLRKPDEALEEYGNGFCEPGPDAVHPAQLDVICAPALAVDTQGYRLGYGAGFYDRALLSHQGFSVAVAYDFQFVIDVPREAHDAPVQCVVTDTRVHRVG